MNPYLPEAIPSELDRKICQRRCGPVTSFLFAIGSIAMPIGLVVLYDYLQDGWTRTFGNWGAAFGGAVVAVSVGLLSLAFVRLQQRSEVAGPEEATLDVELGVVQFETTAATGRSRSEVGT